MTIGIVLHPWSLHPSGLGRMARALTKALVEGHPGHPFIIFTKYPLEDTQGFTTTNWRPHAVSGGMLWLDRVLFSGPRADVYLFFTPVLPLFFRARSVCFVHDFAYLSRFGGQSRAKAFLLKMLHGRSLRKADAVIAVSRFTKGETSRLFGIAPEKIHVVYNGANDIHLLVPEPVAVRQPFVLYAGGLKSRKNVGNVVRGFAVAVQSGFSGDLVIVGKKGGLYTERLEMIVRELNLVGRVRFVGFVSDAQLVYLYRSALVFVFPSRIEGFGMAVVEAMACGTPVIVSNTTALPEVVGDAGLTVNPEDPEAIGTAITNLAQDEPLCRSLSEKGEERAALFSWTRAATETLQVLYTVAINR